MALSDNLSTILPLGTAILSSWLTYRVATRGNRRSDFDSITKANEEFRNEIREDLADAKEEIAGYKDRIEVLERELNDKNELVHQLQTQIFNLTKEIQSLKMVNLARDAK